MYCVLITDFNITHAVHIFDERKNVKYSAKSTHRIIAIHKKFNFVSNSSLIQLKREFTFIYSSNESHHARCLWAEKSGGDDRMSREWNEKVNESPHASRKSFGNLVSSSTVGNGRTTYVSVKDTVEQSMLMLQMLGYTTWTRASWTHKHPDNHYINLVHKLHIHPQSSHTKHKHTNARTWLHLLYHISFITFLRRRQRRRFELKSSNKMPHSQCDWNVLPLWEHSTLFKIRKWKGTRKEKNEKDKTNATIKI